MPSKTRTKSGRPSNNHKSSAARARQGMKQKASQTIDSETETNLRSPIDLTEDAQVTDWDGTVNTLIEYITVEDSESEDSDEIVELDGEELLANLVLFEGKDKDGMVTSSNKEPVSKSCQCDAFDLLTTRATKMETQHWQKVEANQGLGYNGLSQRKAQYD
ncbi:hypothetical protein K439DRAFT_1659226 [Ramaria rubella]|nr:hypothetical protein K439DRAFT_1659226 [Ramaria rubella]